MNTAEKLRAEYRSRRVLMFDGMSILIARAVESPIEEMLFWAFLHLEAHDPVGPNTMHTIVAVDRDELPGLVTLPRNVFAIGSAGWRAKYILQPDIRAGDEVYRIDIAIRLPSIHHRDLSAFVAVECDGHDFHEKTKEQAERDKRRDRDLQSIGWSVARFTGSEIVRDPLSAASSAMGLAAAVLSGFEVARHKAG